MNFVTYQKLLTGRFKIYFTAGKGSGSRGGKMFKTMLVVLVLGLGFAAMGQDPPAKNELHGFVEQECQVLPSGKVECQIKSNWTYDGKTPFGFYVFSQDKKGFHQVYGGPTWSPKRGLQFGVAAGVKTGSQHLQLAGFAYAGHNLRGKYFSNLLLVERGWYRNETSVKLNDRLSLSLASQRFRGTGPRADYRLTKHISAGAEFNFGKSTNFMFGLKYKF